MVGIAPDDVPRLAIILQQDLLPFNLFISDGNGFIRVEAIRYLL